MNSIVNNVVARVKHNIAASCSTSVNNLLTMLRQHDDFCACSQCVEILVVRVLRMAERQDLVGRLVLMAIFWSTVPLYADLYLISSNANHIPEPRHFVVPLVLQRFPPLLEAGKQNYLKKGSIAGK